MGMKKISIMTACYNEEENVVQLTDAVRKIMAEQLPGYDYEHLFIDNCSEDSTLALLREICAKDPHVKVIENARNFGHIRSPFHGLLETTGDCTISMNQTFWIGVYPGMDQPRLDRMVEVITDFVKAK